MYRVDKNNIVVLNKGDYFTQIIDLTLGQFPCKEKWILEPGDSVLFHIMEPHQQFNDAIIKKELTYLDYSSEGDLYVVVRPEDTYNLPAGTYYYQIKLVYTEESSEENVVKVDTVVQKTKFILVD